MPTWKDVLFRTRGGQIFLLVVLLAATIAVSLGFASIGQTHVAQFAQGATLAPVATVPTATPAPTAAPLLVVKNPVEVGQRTLADQTGINEDEVQTTDVGGVAAMTIAGAAPAGSHALTLPSYKVREDLGASLRLRRCAGLDCTAFEGPQPGETLVPTGATQKADGIDWVQVTRLLTGSTGYVATVGLE